jgi:cytochrome b561
MKKMCLKWMNTTQKFGLLTRVLHWSIFALFCAQFFFIYEHRQFPKDAPERVWYMVTHKSTGVILLGLAVLAIIWRQLGNRPPYPFHMRPWEKILARSTHYGLYTVMILMPISGYLTSAFNGYAISLYGFWTVPLLVPLNKGYAEIAWTFHQIFAFAILGLVFLHISGALKHAFLDKDNVVKRMLW